MPVPAPDTNEKTSRLRPWVGFVSGCAGGVADLAINYPPYGIKYRLQCNECIDWKKLTETRHLTNGYTLKYLYRGVLVSSFGFVPAIMIQDGVSTYLLRCQPANAPAYYDAMSTAVGGAASAIVTAPVGNVIIAQQKGNTGMLQAIQGLYYQGGIIRFARGGSVLMCRDSIYGLGVFWGVDYIKMRLEKNAAFRGSSSTTLIASMLAGSMASVLSQIPDTLAAKIQNDNSEKSSPWRIFRKTLQEQGMKEFYRGGLFRALSIGASAYVVYGVTNYVKNRFK